MHEKHLTQHRPPATQGGGAQNFGHQGLRPIHWRVHIAGRACTLIGQLSRQSRENGSEEAEARSAIGFALLSIKATSGDGGNSGQLIGATVSGVAVEGGFPSAVEGGGGEGSRGWALQAGRRWRRRRRWRGRDSG